jgi:hypothetical protein
VNSSLTGRPEDAAGLVDLLGGELRASLLRRPEQRGRAAQRDEEADLEVLRLRERGRRTAALPSTALPPRPTGCGAA